MKSKKNQTKKEIRILLEKFNIYQLLTLTFYHKGENIMKTSKILAVLIAALLVIFVKSNVYAQDDLGTVLSYMNTDSAKQYSQVLTNAMSSNVNSGMFQALKPGNKFSVYFGVKACGTFLNDDEQLPGGLKSLTVVPLAMVQLGAGTVAGTDAFVRFLPSVSIGNYASVSAWGMGVQHNLAKDFKKFPLEVIFRLAYHKMSIDDSKDVQVAALNSWSQSLIIGKQVSIITFYTSLQYENSTCDVKYTDRQNGVKTMKFSLQNENNIKVAAGFNLKAGPVNLNADYNFGKQNAISFGLGFGF